MMPLQIVADGWYRDWCVSGVKSVTDDLPGATASFLSTDQSKTLRSSTASLASAASSPGDDSKMVRSFAYEEMLGNDTGISEMKWLKRAGDMTEPWGTPECIALEVIVFSVRGRMPACL
jgi:hypothetical protein